jgi:hypothetical protein
MKKRYDKRHTPLLLNPGDLVMLKLHHGYRIPGVKNRKLSIQRVGRFKIKRRVSPLAYELELPPNMKIHPVISVTNFEPLPPGEDPYKRPFNDHPPPVEDDHDMDEEWKSFSIEKLLDRRLRRYGRGKKIWSSGQGTGRNSTNGTEKICSTTPSSSCLSMRHVKTTTRNVFTISASSSLERILSSLQIPLSHQQKNVAANQKLIFNQSSELVLHTFNYYVVP